MIYIPAGFAILFSVYLFFRVKAVSILKTEGASAASFEELKNCYETIQAGAKAFLWAEYQVCTIFVILFAVLVFILTSRIPTLSATGDSYEWKWKIGGLTCASFLVGAFTSILSGYIGMMVAVFANGRTTVAALADGGAGWTAAFNVAFRSGAIMGFSNCGLALIILYGLCQIYRDVFTDIIDGKRYIQYTQLFECVSGFGLGGSAIALFGRVGGGIFTKAADVGADLSGKVIGLGDGKKLDEDSPYNPAVIADNVGDNVGDVAGMGSDLFGSLGEASCAAMLLGAAIGEISTAGWSALMYPLYISTIGICACLVMHFVATDIWPVRCETDIEKVLKIQLLGTAIIMSGIMYPVTDGFLPNSMTIDGVTRLVTSDNVYGCVLFGIWAGTIIGFITEYFTSHTYKPTRDVAKACETGAATNIIYGIALGYLSSIIPVGLIAGAVYFCLKTTGLYGVACGALGMLSTLATCLTIDVYGPISDNAGGIAEMAEFPPNVRDKTDALDAAGNTTAAIGKGFAIGSAALVSVSLTGAFVARCSFSMSAASKLNEHGVNLMSAVVFAFLIFGANIPYWFSALTMKSVGEAANSMVREVARQWAEIPGLKDTASLDFDTRAEKRAAGEKLATPDYQRCIAIATNASLKEMIAPAALVVLSPIIVGSLFGVEAVVGLLAGAMSSSVQLAISMSNTGGAWDNAKKFTEKGGLNGWTVVYAGKKSNVHAAAVVGDTVGDPFKDTSGPALNIVMKLMAIISVVFADFFMSINHGNGASHAGNLIY
ncbi:hypothetical protein GUITHDRAFT_157894 [Guillardia theta CCMP2712]|uniref:H(+)-exporting diphosphatase n=1 Tax=Guillardia theta (strain CCMP2712) TaxID=905079 RepID=L1JA21_GUITC|nr:hypothetical protein GUITHDRAFT_157894 [Guillardia theta CCMP2712]EKX44949.1 hypothetical protein GUITHDRAFT_157894 [Guillardia theta CCMP2712]|eukprot:XP_005831929.1 hypothetical protein GUITHDRAFT_157894 [Guillardia theta CCMP2712]